MKIGRKLFGQMNANLSFLILMIENNVREDQILLFKTLISNLHLNMEGGSIIVCECMTFQNIGYLCHINGKMNGDLHRQILCSESKDTLTWYRLDKNDIIFQHDDDPKHIALLTIKWFVDNHMTVLDWPTQSLDLNPIEHLWNEIDRRLRRQSDQHPNREELWDKTQDTWNSIETDFYEKLIRTMSERIQDVIIHVGDNIINYIFKSNEIIRYHILKNGKQQMTMRSYKSNTTP